MILIYVDHRIRKHDFYRHSYLPIETAVFSSSTAVAQFWRLMGATMGAACAECCAESRGRSVAVHVVRFVLPDEEGSRASGNAGDLMVPPSHNFVYNPPVNYSYISVISVLYPRVVGVKIQFYLTNWGTTLWGFDDERMVIDGD